MPETLYLIDGHAQIFRAYYAIRGGMNSPVTGEPTHAIYGFTAMLIKLLSQLHPHYVAVAVDMPGKTFRDEIYEEYKGTRTAAPDDFHVQIPRIMKVIDLFGIPVIGIPGLEADDVIATITRRILDEPTCNDINVRIVSRDKDLEQLLEERVTLFDIHTDTTIDVASLMENKGIRPDQVVDVLALTGDTVDNIPGVEGVGPKTAAKLVHEYGSIDGILENLDKLKGRIAENVAKAKDRLPLNRQLVRLKMDADFDFSLEAARVSAVRLPEILSLFQQLGFNRFQDDVRRIAAAQARQGHSAEQPGLFDESPTPPPAALAEPEPAPEDDTFETAESGHYEAITTRQALESLIETLRKQPILSVDTETTSLRRDAEICGICLSWQTGHGVYIPTRSPDPGSHLDTTATIDLLRPILEEPTIPKCGHNLKYDASVLLRYGVRLHGAVFDSMLAMQLLDPSRSAQLDAMAMQWLHYRMIAIGDLIGHGDAQISMADVPLEKITPYAAEDADITLRLYHRLKPVVEKEGMLALLEEVEAPLSTVLAEMEANGILCDPAELTRQGELLQGRVDQLREEIHCVCGEVFQIDSPKQLGAMLFDKLGFPPVKKTKSGSYSTDIEVLEKLSAQEDRNEPKSCVPGLIIEYRQLQKLISTYLGNLKAAINPKTKRIHTHFQQLVTETGRLASNNPNLQNIPIRTEIGRQIRKAFFAPPDHCLICADYSQIELRILAHFSQDPALVQAFEEEGDIHRAVAAEVFNTSPEAVTRAQRDQAKVINFGIIYGVTPFGLARRIEGLDVTAARKLIEDYRLRFPGINVFLQECVTRALQDGYVSTILGRRRTVQEVRSPNATVRSLGERLAINSVIQGSAADLIKAAMVKVQDRIDREALPMKMLLQIHDELVLEAPETDSMALSGIVREEMENAMRLKVPLKAEAGIGKDWLSAK